MTFDPLRITSVGLRHWVCTVRWSHQGNRTRPKSTKLNFKSFRGRSNRSLFCSSLSLSYPSFRFSLSTSYRTLSLLPLGFCTFMRVRIEVSLVLVNPRLFSTNISLILTKILAVKQQSFGFWIAFERFSIPRRWIGGIFGICLITGQE